jgi:hypothetical protein
MLNTKYLVTKRILTNSAEKIPLENLIAAQLPENFPAFPFCCLFFDTHQYLNYIAPNGLKTDMQGRDQSVWPALQCATLETYCYANLLGSSCMKPAGVLPYSQGIAIGS